MVKNYWIVSYWQQLPKNKETRLGKTGANTSYDHLCKAVKDCLVPVKLSFYEEVATKLNEFPVVFQTDKPMAPFLMETLEGLIKTLMKNIKRPHKKHSFTKTFVTIHVQKQQN